MTTIQISSDLHIEVGGHDIPDPLTLITPMSDILILAGDIGSLYKYEQLEGFLSRLCPHFKVVLYVPGNHEYYQIPDIKPLNLWVLKKRLYKLQNNITNLHILNKSSVRIGDYCIAGATLWSKPDIVIPKYIVRIHGVDTTLYENMYNSDLNYINKMITYCQTNNLKLIVASHYGPTFRILEGAHKRQKLLSLYANKLDYLLSVGNVDTWICGHVHKNFDFVTDMGTRVVGNQKGKPKDKIHDYKTDFTIKFT
jgi:predicted phosphodiesterase